MKHFGILCPPGTGHLDPMSALGYELRPRGHRVTMLGLPDVKSYAIAARLDFYSVGAAEFPVGSTKRSLDKLGKLGRICALLYTVDLFCQGTEVLLQRIPEACRQAGVEALLIDQASFEGSTIAEYLGLPFITICNALLLMNYDFFHRPDPFSR